jgi:hypothetical protein
MKMLSISRFFIVLSALTILALAGCEMPSSEEAARDLSYDAPPPGKIEWPPRIINTQTEVWRPGYWILEEQGFVWIPGEIISRPIATAAWFPAHWAHHTYGWAFEQGHWE